MGRREGPYNNGAWRQVRKQALARAGFKCEECGIDGRLDVDHVVPWRDGGAWFELSNLRCLCRSCHEKKTYRQDRFDGDDEPVFPKPSPRFGPDGRSLGLGTPSRDW